MLSHALPHSMGTVCEEAKFYILCESSLLSCVQNVLSQALPYSIYGSVMTSPSVPLAVEHTSTIVSSTGLPVSAGRLEAHWRFA